MATKKISLDAVQKAIAQVKKQIQALSSKVDPAERGVLDKKVAQLETLARQTGKLCTRTWGVWPAAKKKTVRRSGAARGRKK